MAGKKSIVPQGTAPKSRDIEKAYKSACERYGELGVNVDRAVRKVLQIPISIHCWQADDVQGLEVQDGGAAGGLAVTGNYPGAARNGDEIRQDLDKAAELIPGKVRFNIHAMYAETNGKKVERSELKPKHFKRWIDWAKANKYGLDFNPTTFGHPMMKDGLTLSSPEKAVRDYWIEHGRACRTIAASMARALGSCTHNVWVPDGFKDEVADRWTPRKHLEESLDAILDKPKKGVIDAVESKLFGIGCESYTVGSHEFYMLYAGLRKHVAICLDMGHFHPTETIADKLSAVIPHMDNVLVHVSRGVRWDSDHIVLLNQDTQFVCDEAVRGNALDKIVWALDYFDASVNRVAAYVIGTRALRKGLLRSLLEPAKILKKLEKKGKNAHKLALMEHRQELPFSAVWDYACLKAETPLGVEWLSEIDNYEENVLSART